MYRILLRCQAPNCMEQGTTGHCVSVLEAGKWSSQEAPCSSSHSRVLDGSVAL